MKYLLFVFFSVVLLGCSSSYNVRDTGSGEDSVVQPNERSVADETYIVKTVKNFDTSMFATAGGVYDGSAPRMNILIDGEFYTIKRKSYVDEDIFLKKLDALKGVYYAQKNKQLKAPKVFTAKNPAEPILHPFGLKDGNLNEDPDARNYEYALRITQARNFMNEDGVEQEGAYKKVGYGDKTVVLAIIDSGLNMRHPDFKDGSKSRCLYAKSYFKQGVPQSDSHELSNSSNEDDVGHGTHCSGTMCAVEGNGQGIAGVAYKNTYIISYRALSNNGSTDEAIYGSLADLVQIVKILKKKVADRSDSEKAMIPSTVPQDFVITQKTIPVNMSLGGPSSGQYEVEMMNLAIRNDVLPVVAMGNDGRMQPAYPRSVYGCIAVGATDNKDKRTFFSDAGEWMSVCAPGYEIVSTYNGNWYYGTPSADTTGVAIMSGTSMATPFVTGMIGYLLSFNKGHELTPFQIKKLIEDTADKVDSDNPDFGKYIKGHSLYYGYGRVNVLKAASAVEEKAGAVPIPAVNSFYLEKPMLIRAPAQNLKVRLYEVLPNDELFPQGTAITDSSAITYFVGLKKNTKYKITCEFPGNREKEHTFTTTDGENMQYTFN